ncbi:hypothetical protein MRX96_041498 [Rhipicephalus microplus]
MSNMNNTVFPDPVCAQVIKSLPAKATSAAYFSTGVGLTYLAQPNVYSSLFQRPISSKLVNGIRNHGNDIVLLEIDRWRWSRGGCPQPREEGVAHRVPPLACRQGPCEAQPRSCSASDVALLLPHESTAGPVTTVS